MLALTPVKSQFTTGDHVLIPIGGGSDFYDIGFQTNLGYLFQINEGMFRVGPSASLIYYAGEDSLAAFLDAVYLPITGSFVFVSGKSKGFLGGMDLGYSIAITGDYSESGFYWKGMAGYKFGLVGVTASYIINGGGEYNYYYNGSSGPIYSINTGVEFYF